MTNNPLNLDESVEWAGLWWLPEEADKNGFRVPCSMTVRVTLCFR